MKKLVFIALLAVVSGTTRAQTAALKINNNNQSCTLYAHMHAVETASGNSAPCDIYSNMITVLPGGNAAYTDPANFDGTTGFSFMTFPMTAIALSTTTTWQWTDVTFQWNCPSPCIGSGGGNMTDGWSATMGYNCYASPPSGTSWPGVLGTCTFLADTWTATPVAGFMSDITLNFN